MSKPTNCPTCKMAEGGILERIRFYRKLWFPTHVERLDHVRQIYSDAWKSGLGIGKRFSWYDEHKQLFIEHGDYQELKRMLRHLEK